MAGTFLANGYGGNADAYINDIMAAARESGVSPYVIAGTIRIEQGVNGTSSLISGTYSGYQGYYNFFNYGASGSNVVVNGLKYAKNQGWNSRRASIIGGAKLYASGYISAGQDTYYYMDFNVKFPSKIWHQYATSLYDQCVKAVSMRSVCTANKNAAMTFKIPVYTSMPSSAYRAPTAHTCVGEVKNAKAATCVDSGYSGDTYCKICGKLLSSGSTVPAEGHSYGEWITDVPAGLGIGGLRHRVCTACGNVENEELPPIFSDVPGDVNNDGSLNNRDLTRLYQYLTGWDVTVNRKALDINNDGIVNNKDLSRLLQYLSDWDVVIY